MPRDGHRVAPPRRSVIDVQLGEARSKYLAFVRKRVSDPDLAEDILQDALLRAVQAASDVADENRLSAWFYRVLRNAIIDACRRRDVASRRVTSLERLELDLPARIPEDDELEPCECFRSLLPTLNADYAQLIERFELGDESPEVVAEELGITRNNLKVRRHRARRALRVRLEETCRLCADHGCLDCTCQERAPEV